MEDARGIRHEVHLIDTPGFDDDFDSDPIVLDKIANWTNRLFDNQQEISGILYLHDVSLPRIRGSGLRNLEMLPALIGKHKLDFLTLVTTHWGTRADPAFELKNEEALMTDSKYWQPLLNGVHSNAETRRFDMTTESALHIIQEHLTHTFVPSLTNEMVLQLLPLEQTTAGKIVRRNLDEAYVELVRRYNNDSAKLAVIERRYKFAEDRMRERFNTDRAREYQQRASRLKRKQRAFRTVRWVTRIGATGGIIAAVVVTSGIAAPALAALPLVEVWAQNWREEDKAVRERMRAEHEESYEEDFKAYRKKHLLDEDEAADFESLAEGSVAS